VRISAAILTGGAATRLGGRDKSALVVDGQTILERQLTAISHVTDDVVLIGTPPSIRPAPRCQPFLPPRAVPDLAPGLGPLGGLHTALAETTGDVLLLLACDMPFVSGPFLAYLASLARDADAVVPQTEDGYHPLCAAYTPACRDAVARRLADRRLAMKDLLADVRGRVVQSGEIERFGNHHRLLANVNTPDDFLDAVSGDTRHEP
jgi:molybdopterin-guanine dinucleotide biosynthesis protein A